MGAHDLNRRHPCTLVDDPNIEVLKDAIYVLEAARKYSLDAIEKKKLAR